MKYVLAKDFPLAKAGTEIKWIESRGVLPTLDLRWDGLNYRWVTMSSNREEWNRLIESGWIEEVKPRMWYIPENILRTYASQIKPTLNLPYGEGVVKVTEVLE